MANSQATIQIRASFNRGIIALIDSKGNLVCQISTDEYGTRGSKSRNDLVISATNYAKAVLKKQDIKDVKVHMKGYQDVCMTVIKELQKSGINIIYIKDETPIPHNGTRPKRTVR